MTRTRLAVGAACALLVLGSAYLRDPPWVGQVASGLQECRRKRVPKFERALTK